MVRITDNLTNVEGAKNIKLATELGQISETSLGLKSLGLLLRWADSVDDGLIDGEGRR